MKVNVLKKDILLGRRNNCQHCPIANSLRRENKDIDPYVSGVIVEILNNEKEYFAGYLPKEAVDFIHSFDKGEEVQPFSFKINMVKL